MRALKKEKKNRVLQMPSNAIFNKALTPFWKTFLQLKQMFNAYLFYSRNFGNLTYVTRLEVLLNMTDPISINPSPTKVFFTKYLISLEIRY